MRGVRSLLVLLVLLAAIGGYAIYESRRPAADSGEKKDKVFNVEADKIEEIAVKSEKGDRTMVRKTGTEWQIVQPITAKPDSSEVSGITSNLASLEVQRVIDEKPSEISEYGLKDPRVEVAFKSGGQERKLLIGKKTPPGTDLYAKLADSNRVFLIQSYLDTTFNKGTFDLRDKAVLTVNRDNIDTVTVTTTTPAKTMKVVKSSGEWKLAEPVAVRADFSAIESLVSRLSTLQMKSIAAPEIKKPEEYGLDKPLATVTIGAGSSQARLAVGKSAGEGTVYAQDLSRPMVLTIESSLLDEFKKDPGDYRQKDLFDARAFNANRVEVTRGTETVAFEKTKTKNKDGKDEEKWRQVAPITRDVDQPKVENLISTATQARASSFVDTETKTGLEKPELTIAIKSNDGKREEKVAFAKSGSDGYAARAGEAGAAKIEASTIDNLVKTLDELKKPAEEKKPEEQKKTEEQKK
jgi:Domain of unknown function (DUF4340)